MTNAILDVFKLSINDEYNSGFLKSRKSNFISNFLTIFFIFFSILSSAETDNYYCMDQIIPDASSLVNEEFNIRVQNTIESINAKNGSEQMVCAEVAGKILKSFGVSLATNFEVWIHKNENIEKNPPTPLSRHKYFKKTIYYKKTLNPLHRFWDFMLWTQIDPVINIGGVYLGTDKITHFTASGYLYYKTYQKSLKGGMSEEESVRTAIQRGIKSEKRILGVKSNGIFSYADLEANYQGMKLGLDLCSGENPQLELIDGTWNLEEKIDLTNYINPYLDESFNSCAGKHYEIKRVRQNITDYCSDYMSETVQNRFEFYSTQFELSENMKYLFELQNENIIPDNRKTMLQIICTDSLKTP